MSVFTLEAKLERFDPKTPWGFRMQGGKDFNCPLSIQRINPEGLAAKCSMQVGDIILKIGNVETAVLRHKDAQHAIVSSGNKLDLLLQRRGGFTTGGGYDSFAQPSVNTGGFNPSQGFNASPQSPSSYGAPVSPYSQSPALSPGSNKSPAPLFVPKPASSSATFQPKPASPSPAASFQPGGAPTSKPRPLGGGAPPRPSGKGARRGIVGEAKTLPASTDRIPFCASCSSPIRGPFVTALGNCWCPDHFVCANPQCGDKLIDIGFVEDGGHLYCERDYEKYMAPHCNKCSAAIVGECVNALQTTWHPTCFLCTQCKQPMGGNQFHIEEGKPYCEKDWAAMFQTMCAGCDFPIEPGDRWVEAMGKNFHAECFNCSTCQVSLEGQAFIAKGGKAFCKKHAR